ncbi:hypothetical protein FNQ90_03485 [Streptomyces alkaliphilus]|uniref:Uncharacterized protein n=1 Tax=Streptomyces alkaliphilus TaxID=1472722 RepID=A0A7W3TAE6_9ACTN|nr:hypothetical protein [Streptomyces alkaliphilus]MBB0243196.1 hypothetical protein [Streptomyces alkaliphilus]
MRWEHIAAVVLWERRLRHSRLLYLGLARHSVTTALSGWGDEPSIEKQWPRAHLPLPPMEVSAHVNGWRLDEARLADVVARFAPPGVRVIDTRGK